MEGTRLVPAAYVVCAWAHVRFRTMATGLEATLTAHRHRV